MGITFIYPWLLTLGLLSPLLLLAYLKRTPSRKQLVSSILILKKLTKQITIKQRIKLPPRFYLEALILLLLLLIAAKPRFSSGEKQIAVLIDSSLSMRAVDDETGLTRLKKAKKELSNLVSAESSATYSLYSSSPVLKQLGEDGMSGLDLISRAEEVKATYDSDNLSGAVEELIEKGLYQEIFIISDREPRHSELSEVRSEPELKSINVGKNSENIYISNIRSDEIVSQNQNRIVLTAGMSGASPKNIKVTLSRANSPEKPYSKSIRVEPDRLSDLSFDISANVGANDLTSNLIKLEIEQSDYTPGVIDAIHEDNQGWFVVGNNNRRSVLVVADRSEPDWSKLKSIANFEITETTPARFLEMKEGDRKRFDLLVFHETAPQYLPQSSALFILPPIDAPAFAAKAPPASAILTSWREDHPLTTYLRVPLLKFDQAVPLSVPPWAESVFNGEQGSLVAAGEARGVRFAALGFEILPFEGAATPAMSILTMNLLKWLTESSAGAEIYLTGSTLRLAAGTSWTVTSPLNISERYGIDPKEPNLVVLDQPGIYKLTPSLADSAATELNPLYVEQYISVNAFHIEESSTFTAEPYDLVSHVDSSAEQSRQKKVENNADDLWLTLLSLAVGLLFLDAILQLFRWYRT